MIRILFLAANPTDQSHLRVRQEFDELRRALDAAKQGQRFALIQEFAVAAGQLQELLFRHQPQIVHFSGHGTEGGLIFEDGDGESHLVAPQTLHDLFAGFKHTVRCVVLNACYSQIQANAIATVIDSVVGMSDELTDEAALAFATAFYRALANGTSLADAVDLGRNQLDLQDLDEAHKPQLLTERIDPGQVRALDWDEDVADNQAAVVFIPFLRKSATEFVGRDDELAELHEKLQQSQMVGVRPAAALTGLGGIGKTQLAVEYAYRYQASYPGGIFWINAADLNRVRAQLVETAERMGLRTDHNTTDNALLAGLVKRCQQQPATLLCFDNAPDAVILWRRLTQELNTATLGAAILITTRRRDLPPNMAALDLRRLSDSTVRQLLATARPNLLTDPDLPRLLERLGGLPLVVSLVANALQNSPDATIADYLAALAQHGEETVHEELDVHVTDYDLYREVYTRTLLPVLREQWERLCQQPKSENAQLLLRIAGQLPEAAEIPIARLGLLAGLADGRVIRPLTSAMQTLWKAALIEELKTDAIRLHPLVRDFAESLTTIEDHGFFRIACAGQLASTFYDMQRLGLIYEQRGISAMILDLLTAIDFCHIKSAAYTLPDTYPPRSRPSNKGTLTSLYNFLHIFRYNAHHLQGPSQSWRAERLWQQLLTHTPNSLTLPLDNILSQTLHWLPQWKHEHQSPALEQTLVGHEGYVMSVAVVDGQRIVSASHDRTLKVWNLTTGQVEQTLVGHEGYVMSVAVVDGQRIVSASDDHTLKVWNLLTGQVEQTLVGHEGRVLSVAVVDEKHIVSASADRILKVSASADRILKVWNLQTGLVEQTFRGRELGVHSVTLLNGQRIVSASVDNTLKVWNLQTGVLEQTLSGHESWVTAVAVLDAKRIVSASLDCTLKVWNLQSGTTEQTLYGHTGGVSSVITVDADHLVSTSYDRTLKVWNWRKDEGPIKDSSRWDQQTQNGHKTSVFCVAVVDTQHIVSASDDRTIKLWNLKNGQLKRTLLGHDHCVRNVAVVNATRIVSVSHDRTLKVWNLQSGAVEQTLRGHNHIIRNLAVLDADHIVSASHDRTLKIWNLQNGAVEQTLTGHSGGVFGVAVIDAQRIVSTSDDCTLKIWNLRSGQVEQTLRSHGESVFDVAVVSINCIVSASADRSLKVWNLQSGEVLQTLYGHKGRVLDVKVVDANRIVSASDDHTLKIWNLTTGQIITSIGVDGALCSVAVARQDGRTLVVAGDAGGALYCLELVEPVGLTR